MLPWDLGQLIQLIGYPGLFAIIFAESGLIVGFFLPGASLLFTAGFLASQGFLDIRIIVPLVALAAILGDNVGYWFGAKVGIHLYDRPNSRFFKREHLERTRRFYAKYGTRTILLARFVPMVRTFAPILAGIANMNYRTFMLYNIAGGILWASGISFLGYVLGETVPQTADYIEIVVLAIIVITCIPLARELWKHRFERVKLPKAIIFDLDNTLAGDMSVPDKNMADRLRRLVAHVPIAIMSGRSFAQMEERFLPALPNSSMDNLSLYPDTAGQCYEWKNGAWKQEYNYDFNADEKEHIVSVVEEAIRETGVNDTARTYGDVVVMKEAQITFVIIGYDAPEEARNAWDPQGSKRKKLSDALVKKLPNYEIRIVGRTSIDITRLGINKAYGVRHFAKKLSVEPREMLFIGDALYPGGNDYPVIEAGIDTRQVQNPSETAKLIDTLLATFEKAKK